MDEKTPKKACLETTGSSLNEGQASRLGRSTRIYRWMRDEFSVDSFRFFEELEKLRTGFQYHRRAFTFEYFLIGSQTAV